MIIFHNKDRNVVSSMNEIDELNRIRKAWFLFPAQNHRALLRIACFLILCFYGIGFSASESIASLSRACLVYTGSLIMEFFPGFSNYPTVVSKENEKFITKRKWITIVFDMYLVFLLFLSIYLIANKSYPPFFDLSNTISLYIFLYSVTFIYLGINCVLGMVYTPVVSKDRVKAMNELFIAAEYGGLGNASENKV